MSHAFAIVDVFSAEPFAGNQLAVLPDARGLDTAAMQAVTREFDFAESSFVLPAADPANTRRVRIFTPAHEVPFAGHPTVGTAAALVHLGLVPLVDGACSMLFEEELGTVAVSVRQQADGLYAELTVQAVVEHAPGPVDPALVAAAIGLPAGAVLETWTAGVGVRFCFARLPDAATVDRAVLDRAAWAAAGYGDAWFQGLYLFAGEARDGGGIHARMFAPDMGIAEDPATGSAAVTLAGTAAERDPRPDAAIALRIVQGQAMGRRSVLAASALKAAGRLVSVSVGGVVTLVGTGTLMVP